MKCPQLEKCKQEGIPCTGVNFEKCKLYVPKKPDLKELELLFLEIIHAWSCFKIEADKVFKWKRNKKIAVRSRVLSSRLEKLLKLWRKKTLEAGLKKKKNVKS